MTSLAACRACCQDFTAYCDAAQASPIGAEVPAFPRRDCENPECALFEFMLARMAARGHESLAGTLRRLRETLISKGRRRPAEETR